MARKYTKREVSAAEQERLTNGTAIYMRVSTEAQAQEGYSLDAQRRKLLAYCDAQGWHVSDDHVYIDAGISGTSTAKRAAYQDMMEAARLGGVTRIVAVKLDRLARNVRDFLRTVDELASWGCNLVLIQESFDTGTPTGKFALTMFAAMAELESANIGERVKSGQTQKAREGGWNGGPLPYGYQDGPHGWIVYEREADIVRRIFRAFLDGDKLYRIAQDLNADSVPGQRGGKWYATTVRNVLRNGVYAGLRQWDGIETPVDELPAIVTAEEYEQAHGRLMALQPGRPAEEGIGWQGLRLYR